MTNKNIIKLLVCFILFSLNYSFSQDLKSSISKITETFIGEETRRRNLDPKEIFLTISISSSSNSIENNYFGLSIQMHYLQYLDKIKTDSIYQFKNTITILGISKLEQKFFDTKDFIPIYHKQEVKIDTAKIKRLYHPLVTRQFYFNPKKEITFIEEPLTDKRYYTLLKEKVKFAKSFSCNTYNNPYGTNRKKKKKK
ncbi:MAG TPA: hypothetical protein VF677_08600 [Flavobacterium sp.]|jgi:hypothetical protein